MSPHVRWSGTGSISRMTNRYPLPMKEVIEVLTTADRRQRKLLKKIAEELIRECGVITPGSTQLQ